jgi:CRISPR-associated protein Csb2
VATVFVPVNDVAMTNVDQEAKELDQARARLDAAQLADQPKAIKKAVAAAEKAKKRFAAAVACCVSIPAKAINPAAAMNILPEHHIRRPRTFPSVTPADPRVT